VTNPEDALNYALNFPAYLRQSPSILQVICKPYQDLQSEKLILLCPDTSNLSFAFKLSAS
jgi:hypothetical protein